MRTETFPVRSSRKSLDPYPSPASLPCDSGYADVEILPSTFDESDVPHKKRHCIGTGRGGLEPLNLDACIVCDISDEFVSRCSGIDCLVSFHAECLNAELGSSEDLANSYCPYCWFKILALKSKSLREKAVEAEKAVVKYLDKDMKSRYEVKESVPETQDETALSGDGNREQEHSVDSTDIVSDQELQEENDAYSSKEEQVQVEKDSDKLNEENMPSVEEADQSKEDKGKLKAGIDKSGDMKEDKVIDRIEASEKFQDAEGDKDDITAKDQTKVNTGALEKGADSPFLSIQESFSRKEHDQVQQNDKQRRRRRRIELKAMDSEISSDESTNERNGEDVTEQITSSAHVTSPQGKIMNQQRKHSATTKVAKSKTVRDISFFKKDQRRRLFWTNEEEEMLKVGVEKFAAEANKNMPWRKILEMGDKVFHETRTPADLKDKWRNMIRVEQKTNKTAH